MSKLLWVWVHRVCARFVSESTWAWVHFGEGFVFGITFGIGSCLPSNICSLFIISVFCGSPGLTRVLLKLLPGGLYLLLVIVSVVFGRPRALR